MMNHGRQHHQSFITFGLIVTLTFICFTLLPYSAAAFAKKRTKPSPPPTDTTEQGSMALKILSYNIHGLDLPFGVDHSRYKDIGLELKRRRQNGTAPQIVAIQEAFHIATDAVIIESEYPYVAFGPPGNGFVHNSGLLILSEYPITDVSYITYKNCTNFDCMAKKGVMQGLIHIPGMPKPLEFYNTHLNASYECQAGTGQVCERASDPSEPIRMTQIEQIKDFMKTTHDPDRLFIFPGDFNHNPDGLDYLYWIGYMGLKNSTHQCFVNQNCTGDDNAQEDWLTSVDHQYYIESTPSQITSTPTHFEKTFTEKVDGRYLSDHDGLEIDYQIEW